MLKGFLLGVLTTVVVALIFTFVGITQGFLIPANADARPSALERWAASKSLHAAIARGMPTEPNPVSATDASYKAGIKLYAQNCAVCHGTAGERPSTIAVGLYQHAPQLPKHGVEDDPEGETFWKIKHGIRMTGMPSYTRSLSDAQIWTLALFLKHMNALPPGPEKYWKSIKNPVALAPASALPPPRGSTSDR